MSRLHPSPAPIHGGPHAWMSREVFRSLVVLTSSRQATQGCDFPVLPATQPPLPFSYLFSLGPTESFPSVVFALGPLLSLFLSDDSVSISRVSTWNPALCQWKSWDAEFAGWGFRAESHFCSGLVENYWRYHFTAPCLIFPPIWQGTP